MRRTLMAIAAAAAIFMAGPLASGQAEAAQVPEATELARTPLAETASATVSDYARYRRRGRWHRYGHYRPRYRYHRRYYRPRYYRSRPYRGPRLYRRYYY